MTISMIRCSGAHRLRSLPNVQACRINSRSSGETSSTRHLLETRPRSFGSKYSVLIETCPEIATECGVFAGIHTARSGGTTQMPSWVRTVMTPLEANNNWSSGCECSGMQWPSFSVADTLATSQTSRPWSLRRMLGHLCDTFCHFSEIGFHWQARFFGVKEVLKEALMLEAGKLAG